MDGPGVAVEHRLLQDAEDFLRPQPGAWSAVLLLRLWRSLRGGHRRYADRRIQDVAHRHPARRRRVAEPGHRYRSGRRRLYSGRRLADHRGTGVERQGQADDQRPGVLQDPGSGRHAARSAHQAGREPQESGGHGVPFQGRRRAAVHARHRRLVRHQGRRGESGRLPSSAEHRRPGNTGKSAMGL